MKAGKIHRILTLIITSVTCVLAVPLAFHQDQILLQINQSHTITSLALFLSCFLLMILAGWVKKIR